MTLMSGRRLTFLLWWVKQDTTTTALCKSGWIFKQDSSGASFVNESSGLHAHEVTIFAGCPWVRLHPHAGLDTQHEEWTLSGVGNLDHGVVNPLGSTVRVRTTPSSRPYTP